MYVLISTINLSHKLFKFSVTNLPGPHEINDKLSKMVRTWWQRVTLKHLQRHSATCTAIHTYKGLAHQLSLSNSAEFV